jgi:hypothetical protein
MDPLPSANTEITQFFRQWLETFAGYVREVDYALARPLFHRTTPSSPALINGSPRNGTMSGRRPPTSVSSLSRPRFWLPRMA